VPARARTIAIQSGQRWHCWDPSEQCQRTLPLRVARIGDFPAGRYIPGMPKRKRETEWEVMRLKATPAAFVGLVQAPRQYDCAKGRD
jgi:hypothetical protein